MVGDITSANAIIIYKDNFFALAGMPLMKFSADQSIVADEVTIAEGRMGVDGHLAAGYTPSIKAVTITLEADSPSWKVIEQSIKASKTAKTLVKCQLEVTLISTGRKYTLSNGYIKSYQALGLSKVQNPISLKMEFERD